MTLAQARRRNWDWEFAWEHLPELLDGMWVTIQITVLGMALALTLGLVLAIARRTRTPFVRWPVAVVIEFIRSTPLLVQLLFLFLVLPSYGYVFPAFTLAVVGLGVHYACYTSETYRAGIESVERGQWEAATALNLSKIDTWRSVVLPQAVPRVIPALGNYVVASFKDAPIAAYITVFTVVGAANRIQAQTFRGLEVWTMTGVLFLAVSVPAAIVVRLLEKRYGTVN